VFAAGITMSFGGAIPVAIGVSLTIAALAAAPLEVSSCGLIALGTLFGSVAELAYNISQLCTMGARKLCPELLAKFNYTEHVKANRTAELRVGKYNVFIAIENFGNISAGMLAEITRRVFAGLAEFSEPPDDTRFEPVDDIVTGYRAEPTDTPREPAHSS